MLVGVVLSHGSLTSCERAASPEPDVVARTILEECKNDSNCVRERWHRDPRNWSLGLRAEVAWRKPDAPLVVTTTREIVTPERRDAACLPQAAHDRAVFYQTAVWGKDSGEFPFVVFHWGELNQAMAGHKQALAAAARVRGDEEKLWRVIDGDASLEAACVRFRGKRDRCQGGEQ